MSDATEIRKYLELRLAECQKKPQLHIHQIPAYRAVIAKVEQTGDTGDMFEVSRGEAMDRYNNLIRICRTMETDVKLRANFMNLNAAKDAASHGEMGQKLSATTEAAAEISRKSSMAVSSIRTLLEHLLTWKLHTDRTVAQSSLQMLRHYAGIITQGDPEFSWNKLCEYTPYRQQVPFDDARLATLGTWYKEAAL